MCSPSLLGSRAPEDPRELVRGRFLELIVAAVAGLFVGPPALERRRVPEPVALEVIVRNLCHAFEPQRLPGQVLAPVPTRGRAGEPLPGGIRGAEGRPVGPLLPGMTREGRLAPRLQLLPQRRAAL